MYYGALKDAADAIAEYSEATGLMTDELTVMNAAGSSQIAQQLTAADVRDDTVSYGGFGKLALARVVAQQGIGALQRYNDVPRAYVGELYALQGMTEVLLAEGFCSGIPLTQATYGENFRYTAGFSTQDVLSHALALFDTALVFGKDSVEISTLARVGQGRALLDLGEFAKAAAVIESVPVSAQYQIYYTRKVENPWWFLQPDVVQVLNAEGGTGLDWIAPTATQQDPRIPVTTTTDENDVPVFTAPIRQAKFGPSTTTLLLASGIEARLIEAESQLQPASHPAGPWLQTLNDLRRTIGLADTTDPGTESGRVDLLFRERAFWLYLTGHRQGDLRRLIRDYHRTIETVYPTGPYPWWPEIGHPYYNNVATIVLPKEEEQRNTLYHGCMDRLP
jgi:hypothetical protein